MLLALTQQGRSFFALSYGHKRAPNNNDQQSKSRVVHVSTSGVMPVYYIFSFKVLKTRHVDFSVVSFTASEGFELDCQT